MSDLIEAFVGAILEPLFEYVLKGPAFLILRVWRPQSALESDELTLVFIGIAFWAVVAVTVWALIVLL